MCTSFQRLLPPPPSRNRLIVCTVRELTHTQDVMFELFTKNWAYGYVTDYDDFEFLSTQWFAVVASAYDTEAFVVVA